ncbi:hypothetical protein GCM10010185_42460 [Saccharothrix coeruleofusca]|uniref:Uncharacterized protein n=1 Tax=Saccharothrix coeruleofusca TaxID=33919 RepID=A0A918ANZ3_9PSEU|nr:hypothetical protein GCM10010185_42460 [Saccharothrix coeruleofusca]
MIGWLSLSLDAFVAALATRVEENSPSARPPRRVRQALDLIQALLQQRSCYAKDAAQSMPKRRIGVEASRLRTVVDLAGGTSLRAVAPLTLDGVLAPVITTVYLLKVGTRLREL